MLIRFLMLDCRMRGLLAATLTAFKPDGSVNLDIVPEHRTNLRYKFLGPIQTLSSSKDFVVASISLFILIFEYSESFGQVWMHWRVGYWHHWRVFHFVGCRAQEARRGLDERSQAACTTFWFDCPHWRCFH
jgi:hypothetical protein